MHCYYINVTISHTNLFKHFLAKRLYMKHIPDTLQPSQKQTNLKTYSLTKNYFSLMMMNCFCGMVDRRKAVTLLSSRDHCQRSSPPRNSDTPRAGFEPAQKLSSGLVEWNCAVVITTTPRVASLLYQLFLCINGLLHFFTKVNSDQYSCLNGCCVEKQRRIQNSAKHLRWSFYRK